MPMEREKVIKGLELLKQRLILQADVLGYGEHISDIDNALELLKRAGCILEEGLHYFPCGRKLLEDETYCEGDVKDGKTKNDSAREVY